MRTTLAVTLFLLACGGPQPKKESSMVNEGDTSPSCCCKTVPMVSEKDIQPVYTIKARMECSSDHGDCVDDVQCNGQQAQQKEAPEEPANPNTGKNGVPPPPTLGGASAPAVPK